MNTEEQMAIIENWAGELRVLNDPDGRKVGLLRYHNQNGWTKQVGPFIKYDDVIDVAYNIVQSHVWETVMDIEG